MKTLSILVIGFFFLLLVGKEHCCSSPSPKINRPGNRQKFWATSRQKSPTILHHLHVTHLKVITQENTLWNKLSKVPMPPGDGSEKAVLEWVLYEHKALKRHCGINAHYDCVTCLFATLVSLSRFNGVLSKLMHFNNIEYSTAPQSFTFVSPKSRDFSRLEITLPFACVVPPELPPLTTH